MWCAGHLGDVTKFIGIKFDFCAPKIFKISNNSTVFEKEKFQFETRVTFVKVKD